MGTLQSRLSCLAVLTMLAALPSASAQSVAALQVDLRPLDQRVADVGILSSSLRIIQPGLEVPTSFDQVYRVPGSDDQLMRIQGALRAVYPTSQAAYIQTPYGVVPDIPAGTVFHIGPPAEFSATAGRADRLPGSALRWNTRIADTRLPGREEPSLQTSQERSAADESSPGILRTVPPAIRADPGYRSQRIRELLHRAESAGERE